MRNILKTSDLIDIDIRKISTKSRRNITLKPKSYS